ncbi:DEAD/DEAH box helicase family protein [Ralstonia sp. GX3-BWBA]|uniref:DEAD/DEAH box helicase n=1 Tax=Ralstonia sp. GX3-BWBA TaxID=2219865 RepID=UPI000DD369ED|nr:DEAD/DEAH box helicase family protein [Ralstonia sp. GX3-BWBA]
MDLKLPPVMGIDIRFKAGHVQQIIAPERTVSCDAVRYTIQSARGVKFTTEHREDLYVFSKKPNISQLPQGAAVLVSSLPTDLPSTLDLSSGLWQQHPLTVAPRADATASIRRSWQSAFRYVDEDSVTAGVIAMRRPQLGALHAIHAHWSVSAGVATVVMPTGTGKTETMLATLISAACERVLVLVPTDALRIQITEKFRSLGILKHDRATVLAEDAATPIVGMLTKQPQSPEEVRELFSICNVIVTTSALAGGCSDEVQEEMANSCSHLFIDEAHHVEAPTWKHFKSFFKNKKVLQFTATPFREDGQPLDGKIIYVYPLRQAQAEGYFKQIRFSAVYAFDSARADAAIAAKVIEELSSDTTGKHVAMARVSTTARAETVLAIYQRLGRYNPVMLHSRLKKEELKLAREQLLNGNSRIVVCVDMLGEGFDMPELKIAAFHDLRKSLAVTLQLAGRFTRARSDLGAPVFIANTADVNLREELRTLYSQDPDWNVLLPTLSDGAIGEEIDAQQFLAGFDGKLDEIPLTELHPAASMVVYRTRCSAWNPHAYKSAFRGLSKDEHVYPILNAAESTLVVLAARRQGVPWTDLASIQGVGWELCVAVWDREKSLLYIHGSTNTGLYGDLAKALCGADVSLVTAPEVFRVLSGINRLMLTNVGLDEHIGRQIRYTGRMGPDVGARLSDATLGTTKKAVLAGVGFEHGAPTSIGAGKRGRVWSNLRLRINTFVAWCKRTGAKIADETLNPEEALAGTLIPRLVTERPRVHCVGVDWPTEILDHVESATSIIFTPLHDEHLTNVGIEVKECSDVGPLVVRLFTDSHEVFVRLEFVGSGSSADFRFVYDGVAPIQIRRGTTMHDLCEFLTEHPPTIWFADGSSLEGNQHIQLRTQSALYRLDKLVACDWFGVDIRKESQGETRRTDSVQYRTIQRLKATGNYNALIDDDGAGEAADIVGIQIDDLTKPRLVTVDLFHCKYAHGDNPGGRIDDLYVVCGQAQKSVMWLHNKDRRTDLFAHLLKREGSRVERGRPTRFEAGDRRALEQIRDLSRTCAISLRIFVVQPGLSKTHATTQQLALLGVTERFLHETYQVHFEVMCSA